MPEEKQQVFNVYNASNNYLTAYYMVDKHTIEIPIWGGCHKACVQMTKDMVNCCTAATEERLTMTIKKMIDLV